MLVEKESIETSTLDGPDSHSTQLLNNVYPSCCHRTWGGKKKNIRNLPVLKDSHFNKGDRH